MVNANDRNEELLDQSESDATNDETLSEIEESESEDSNSTPGLDPGPSPDGAFDESKETGPI